MHLPGFYWCSRVQGVRVPRVKTGASSSAVICVLNNMCAAILDGLTGVLSFGPKVFPTPPSTEHITEVLECSDAEQERTSMKKTLNTQWKWPLGSWLLSEQLKHLMFVHCKDWLKCLCLCFLSLSLSLLARFSFLLISCYQLGSSHPYLPKGALFYILPLEHECNQISKVRNYHTLAGIFGNMPIIQEAFLKTKGSQVFTHAPNSLIYPTEAKSSHVPQLTHSIDIRR